MKETSMNETSIRLVHPSALRPTEEIEPGRVREVIAMIVACQTWTQPIRLEGTTLAILDGHHRHAAAIQLGLNRVPVQILDYDAVELGSWRSEISPTRTEVLRRARTGDLYPPKTTRHTFAPTTSLSVRLASLLQLEPQAIVA